eukprot:INCI5883.4.p1 GENE.INCI5883.4~~INCI5883.4.p1  ORF type:complete len:132 (+),score=18.07 INCI5883.4:114-509(+)
MGSAFLLMHVGGEGPFLVQTKVVGIVTHFVAHLEATLARPVQEPTRQPLPIKRLEMWLLHKEKHLSKNKKPSAPAETTCAWVLLFAAVLYDWPLHGHSRGLKNGRKEGSQKKLLYKCASAPASDPMKVVAP